MDTVKFFEEVYHKNIWNDLNSRSGTGSNLEVTKKIREFILPTILAKYNIKTVADIPCGDFFWMKEVKEVHSLETFIGCDIVEDLIKENEKKYTNKTIKFKKLNLLNDPLSKFDLILCRDCLVHFSYADIYLALSNIIKSQSTYLLTTTFPGRTNKDISTGNWRPIDLEKFPFFLPKPKEIFSEGCDEYGGSYSDKSLGLFYIDRINLFWFCVSLNLMKLYRIILTPFRKHRA